MKVIVRNGNCVIFKDIVLTLEDSEFDSYRDVKYKSSKSLETNYKFNDKNGTLYIKKYPEIKSIDSCVMSKDDFKLFRMCYDYDNDLLSVLMKDKTNIESRQYLVVRENETKEPKGILLEGNKRVLKIDIKENGNDVEYNLDFQSDLSDECILLFAILFSLNDVISRK